MFITNNPKDEVYKDLIDLAFEICEEFILVVRDDISKTNNINHVLEKLQPSLKEVWKQSEWPGTTCCSEALVYYYNTDNHAKEMLKKVSNSLHEWLQPNLPEDLSFVKNSKPWLINTSHESESYILTDDEQEIEKILKVRGLKVRV